LLIDYELCWFSDATVIPVNDDATQSLKTEPRIKVDIISLLAEYTHAKIGQS